MSKHYCCDLCNTPISSLSAYGLLDCPWLASLQNGLHLSRWISKEKNEEISVHLCSFECAQTFLESFVKKERDRMTRYAESRTQAPKPVRADSDESWQASESLLKHTGEW